MKRWMCLLLIVSILFGATGLLSACTKQPDPPKGQKTILFLGDSIAEGVAGPSPAEGRWDYSYYSILGRINGYVYHNRAISGNQTHQLLAYVNREEEDGYLTKTLMTRADIVSISITGNDFLWNNFPAMMYELLAKDVYGEDYVDREDVAACYVYHKYSTVTSESGEVVPIAPGDGLRTMQVCLDRAYQNLSDTVDRIRSLNPDVVILLQNVYNMMDDDSELMPKDLTDAMQALDPAYDYATPEGVAKYRAMAGRMLGSLSGVIERYVAAHPQNNHFVDVAKAFDDIYKQDHARGSRLVFSDGLHPSDEGHAVIAQTIQSKLAELGLASGDALSTYRSLCKDRLTKYYAQTTGFALQQAQAALDRAATMDEATKTYFDQINGFLPTLSAHPTEGRATNGKAFEEDKVYLLADAKMGDNDDGTVGSAVKLVTKLLADRYDYTFRPDGTATFTLSLPLGGVLGLVGGSLSLGEVLGGKEDTFYANEDGTLTNLMMSGARDAYSVIDSYAEALFPGVAFTGGNFGRHLAVTYPSMGIGIEGIESLTSEPYTDPDGLPLDGGKDWAIDPDTVGASYNSYLDYLVAYIGRYSEVVDHDGKTLHVDRLPPNLLAKLSSVETVTIKLETVYSLMDLTDSEGKKVQAIYLGAYHQDTSPWLVLTRNVVKENEDDPDEAGVEHLTMRIEVLGLVLDFVAQE